MENHIRYNYEEKIKRETDIYNFIETIRYHTREISESFYQEKEQLQESDIQSCIEQVLSIIEKLNAIPKWISLTISLKELISNYIRDFIKHEQDNYLSMGSASTNYWNNLLDSRRNLYEMLLLQ